MDKVKILNWVKSRTDSGLLFRLRSRALLSVLYLVNADLLLKLWLRPRRRRTPSATARIGILSMYRPIFWHGNIFEMQVNKTAQKLGKQSVHLLCRGGLEVCDTQFLNSNKDNNPTICTDCRSRNRLFYSRNNADTLWIDEHVSKAEMAKTQEQINALGSIDEALAFQYAGMPVGRMVRLSVCRYFLRLGLDGQHLSVFKKFLASSVFLHIAFTRILETGEFDRFLIFNGRYATYNIPLQLMRERGIPFATYELSEQERFFFSVNDIAVLWHDVRERFQGWLELAPKIAQLKQQVNAFISQRRKLFVSSYVDLNSTLQMKDQVDVALFTNVVWDSAAFDRDTLFAGQFDWVAEMVEWAAAHPSIRMVIRIHPAETNVTYNKSDERMLTFIERRFPHLPPNVQVIPPHERRNSYGLIDQARVVTAYSSSIGLEAALSGKPVFMAAWTHFIQDGITRICDSKADYFAQIEKAAANPEAYTPNADQVNKYIYWYYKVYHRLNHTHLHNKPFVLMEDSRFLRVPKIEPSASSELRELTEELCQAPNPQENTHAIH